MKRHNPWYKKRSTAAKEASQRGRIQHAAKIIGAQGNRSVKGSTTSFAEFLKTNGARSPEETGQLKRAVIGRCGSGPYIYKEYARGASLSGRNPPSLWLASEDAVTAFKNHIRLTRI